MAQHALVTLESPDGRRYKTDSPTEINLLVGSYGYTRIGDDSGKSKKTSQRQQHSSPQASTPKQDPPDETPQTPQQ